MSIYKIKSVARRSTAFVLATAFFGGVLASALPGVASADAYNPLTERSLMLSSSSPGWAYTDGSGNANNANVAPGSGANGQKTEETFSFKVSTNSTGAGPDILAMTFQYCTTPAGNCTPPGNGTVEASQQSNLHINYTTPAETTDFEVRKGASTWDASTQATGWTMKTYRLVDAAGSTTTEKNFITLVHNPAAPGASPFEPAAGEMVWIRFKASATNYITNPGAGAFFVKINTFDTDDSVTTDTTPANGIADAIDPLSATGQGNIIDGGVTVANVMNQSIWITTKVLETMAFSVGLTNPDYVNTGNGTHGPCDPITNNTELKIGNPAAENSLEFNTAWDASSYWRLSTNSSAGATVYYAGNTLRNTVGDDIDAIGATKSGSHPGEEQFGLAIDDRNEPEANDAPNNVITPLVATTNYNGGGDPDINDANENNNAFFAFNPASNTEPEPIASNSSGVLQCATAKMRYIANIAPFTPAGVYTTKINYIAAPKY